MTKELLCTLMDVICSASRIKEVNAQDATDLMRKPYFLHACRVCMFVSGNEIC